MDSKRWHKKAYLRNGIPDTENKLVVDKGEGLEKGEGKDWVWDQQIQRALYREWTNSKVLRYTPVNTHITELSCWAAEIDTLLSTNYTNKIF